MIIVTRLKEEVTNSLSVFNDEGRLICFEGKDNIADLTGLSKGDDEFLERALRFSVHFLDLDAVRIVRSVKDLSQEVDRLFGNGHEQFKLVGVIWKKLGSRRKPNPVQGNVFDLPDDRSFARYGQMAREPRGNSSLPMNLIRFR